jgi:hypothetical protein
MNANVTAWLMIELADSPVEELRERLAILREIQAELPGINGFKTANGRTVFADAKDMEAAVVALLNGRLLEETP